MVFNSLVGLKQRVRQAWSQVDIQLKRRADLIPNLVTLLSKLAEEPCCREYKGAQPPEKYLPLPRWEEVR